MLRNMLRNILGVFLKNNSHFKNKSSLNERPSVLRELLFNKMFFNKDDLFEKSFGV